MVYRLILVCGRALLRLLGLRVSVEGGQHLPRSGAAVLAISHFSYLDFALTGRLAWTRGRRTIRFLAIAAAFRHRLAGPLMRSMRHIPVEQGAGVAALRAAGRRLEAGELVGVFPESRVTRSFTLLPLAPGAAYLSIQAQVPLIPVVLWGSHRVLTRTRHFSLREAWRAPVHLVVGAPLHPAPGADPHVVTAELAEAMNRLLGQAQAAYPVAPPGMWWQPAHLGGSAPTPAEADLVDRPPALLPAAGAPPAPPLTPAAPPSRGCT
ncbi:MAG: 1-acyl-sn-glycerol-3-phosphateacyltransferase-li ke [Frankiales bacterium]|nr:1-acyl-sn-glycerol-3-phosphateacyltransferase-li ke [Frankiales bacterium]